VKPICRAPLRAAASGASPASTYRVMFSNHHDRVVDDKAGSNRQCHQRQIIEAKAKGSHAAKRGD
jgi:hypothetical protein